jgi:membrane protein implicated in regulation of membrane protease activity
MGNLSKGERVARVVAGVLLAAGFMSELIPWGTYLQYLVALALVVTGVVNWSPIVSMMKKK